MISSCLHPRDLGAAWVPAEGGWSAGGSVIRPYQHPALHAVLLVSPGRTAVIVRERIGGAPPASASSLVTRCSEGELDRELQAARSWPLDFLELLITRRQGPAAVELRCGSWGTAPVYLLADGGRLRMDWNVTRLYPHLRSADLEPGFAAQYLFHLEHPYSRRTIFPGVWMLTERATATWEPPFRDVKIAYPAPQDRARAKCLKRNASVVETFREILSASTRRWLIGEDEPAAVELSGGLDSSIVAATLAGITSGPVRSYGMIMPGPLGGYQRARRDEVVRRFGLVDSARPCIDHPPFSPDSSRVRDFAVVPWGEFYDEAVGAMLAQGASQGVRLIFTGMGGDELCSYQSGELAGRSGAAGGDSEVPPFATTALQEACAERSALVDDAPQASMYTSSLESAAAVSTLYLSHGVWPVSPLCTPELVEFCRRLPFRWRHRRVIERKVLQSLGCSPTVAYPRPEHLEDFCEVMDAALRKASSTVIAGMFRNSRLADQGLVDRDALIATYARHRLGDSRFADQILGAAVLELTIRSIEQQRAHTLLRDVAR